MNPSNQHESATVTPADPGLPRPVPLDSVPGQTRFYLPELDSIRFFAFLSVFVDRLSGLLMMLALAAVATFVAPVELPTWVVLSVWGSTNRP